MADVSAWGLALSPVLSGAVGAGAAIITTKLSSNAEETRWQRERAAVSEERREAEAREERLEQARIRSEDRQAVVEFLSLARQIGLAVYTARLGGRIVEPSDADRGAISRAFERVQMTADHAVANAVQFSWDRLQALFEASRADGRDVEEAYYLLQVSLTDARTAFRA